MLLVKCTVHTVISEKVKGIRMYCTTRILVNCTVHVMIDECTVMYCTTGNLFPGDDRQHSTVDLKCTAPSWHYGQCGGCWQPPVTQSTPSAAPELCEEGGRNV